jgi:exodeoxyribonuclease I
MMRQVRAKMNDWCREGAIFIGWNSMRFDEAMLRQAYYQSLLPVYQTNTNGNGRADLMRMAKVVAACVPNAIAVPSESRCRRTFKLKLVAEANGRAIRRSIRSRTSRSAGAVNAASVARAKIAILDNAHEALADAEATLAVAQLLKQRAPQIWSALVGNARKARLQQLIERNPVLLLSETYSAAAFNMMVAPISVSCSNPNERAVFDLPFDPEQLMIADDGTVRDAIDGNIKKIRRVSANAQPPWSLLRSTAH